MAPRPTEITLLAKMMAPGGDDMDDAKELARDMIEALDKVRLEREQWVISVRNGSKSPVTTIGPFGTKNQAMKGTAKLAFDDDPDTTPGVGWIVHRMYQPTWLDKY